MVRATLYATAYGPNSNQMGNNRWFHDAYYLTYDGTTWSEPVNLSGTNGVAEQHRPGVRWAGAAALSVVRSR